MHCRELAERVIAASSGAAAAAPPTEIADLAVIMVGHQRSRAPLLLVKTASSASTTRYRVGAQPLKSRMRAYCVGGTPCVQPPTVTVLRVPLGTMPPLQVSVVHWV